MALQKPQSGQVDNYRFQMFLDATQKSQESPQYYTHSSNTNTGSKIVEEKSRSDDDDGEEFYGGRFTLP